MKATYERWILFIKSFSFLFPTILVSAIILFFSVLALFRGIIFGINDSPIWIWLGFRGYHFREILDTPMIYLSSISFMSALIGAVWTALVVSKFPNGVIFQVFIVPWIALILTGPIWGLFWSINHWPVESFGNVESMMLFRRSDMQNGLTLSWLSAAQSYPLNILSYLVYGCLLLINKRLFLTHKEGTK